MKIAAGRGPVPLWTAILAAALSAACGGGRPHSSPEALRVSVGDHETGYASWYGPDYHGNRTASGERYNMFDLTAAHPTWPFGTMVRVLNLENDRSVVVRINDRGPFSKGRIIDLSYKAAREIEISRSGTVRVRIEVVALPEGPRASEGMDLEDLLEHAVRVVPLSEEDALGIVDLHVRERRDAVLPHDGGLPVHDVHLANGDVVPPRGESTKLGIESAARSTPVGVEIENRVLARHELIVDGEGLALGGHLHVPGRQVFGRAVRRDVGAVSQDRAHADEDERERRRAQAGQSIHA